MIVAYNKQVLEIEDAFGGPWRLSMLESRDIKDVPRDLKIMIADDPLGVLLCGVQVGFFIAADLANHGFVTASSKNAKEECFKLLGYSKTLAGRTRVQGYAMAIVSMVENGSAKRAAVANRDDSLFLYMLGQHLGFRVRKHEF